MVIVKSINVITYESMEAQSKLSMGIRPLTCVGNCPWDCKALIERYYSPFLGDLVVKPKKFPFQSRNLAKRLEAQLNFKNHKMQRVTSTN